jgi:hypothetical protein
MARPRAVPGIECGLCVAVAQVVLRSKVKAGCVANSSSQSCSATASCSRNNARGAIANASRNRNHSLTIGRKVGSCDGDGVSQPMAGEHMAACMGPTTALIIA